MMKVSDSVAAIAGAALALLAQPASARADDSKLGKVHFETSCTPQAQKLFDQAMLYQHSFWYRASQKVFEDVLKADPECGIAYWGIALSLLLNPHVAPPAKNLAEGATAIAKGKSVGAKTERERGFIDALAVMYTERQGRSPYARRPIPRPWNNRRSVFRMTMRSRSTTRCRSILRHRGRQDRSQRSKAPRSSSRYLRVSRNILASHTILIDLYDYPLIAEKVLNGRSSTPRSRRTLRTRSICRRISSCASGTGRNSINSNAVSSALRRTHPTFTISCMPWTIRSTPICSSVRIRRQKPSSTT